MAYATVNGQTGKVVTDLPIDTKKYLLGSLLLALPIFIILNLFFTIVPSTLLIISAILSVIAMIFLKYELSRIKKRESGELDRGSVFKKKQTAAAQNSKKKQSTETKKSAGFATALVALVISLLILLLNPVSDVYYYAGVIFSAAALLITIKDIIYYYNIMATRRLPQFDRTGGDDNA